MPKVVVNHTGMTDGVYYNANEPVELPQAVVDALGDAAAPFVEGEAAPEVKKEVKRVRNKMVQKADATTKDVAPEKEESKPEVKKEAEVK